MGQPSLPLAGRKGKTQFTTTALVPLAKANMNSILAYKVLLLMKFLPLYFLIVPKLSVKSHLWHVNKEWALPFFYHKRTWRTFKPYIFVKDGGQEYWSLEMTHSVNYWNLAVTTSFTFLAAQNYIVVKGEFFMPALPQPLTLSKLMSKSELIKKSTRKLFIQKVTNFIKLKKVHLRWF